MCQVTRNTTVATPASVEATPVIGSVRGSKSVRNSCIYKNIFKNISSCVEKKHKCFKTYFSWKQFILIIFFSFWLLQTASRISPFRRIAKTARVNLNKYWGIISQKQRSSSPAPANKVATAIEFDHAAEMEQNHINEMLEALANAEEQNSLNSQIESEFSSPEQPRRTFVRQRALLSSGSYSSCNSFSSYGSSPYYMDCNHSVASRDSFY